MEGAHLNASSPRRSTSFCEINYSEIVVEKTIGRGAYGLVQQARWRDRTVAIKIIDGEMERQAFIVELAQLSRVNHDNIVRLFGACTQQRVCLVMEFMECGSLYDLLYGRRRISYSVGHALSWALQCARGVEYLHGMQPKPLVHRDLKPPNLLLTDCYRWLKICDFGTAADLTSTMTNNKGSAAWMAPEVFEGSKYSEKCDVFSFGIILWEVFTRQKPFQDEQAGPGVTAFRVMWAVHSGRRPQPISRCPAALRQLMTVCWHQDARVRPSMAAVVAALNRLSQTALFPQSDVVLRPGRASTEASDAMDTDSSASFSTVQAFEGEPVTPLATPPAPRFTVSESPLINLPSAPASLASLTQSVEDVRGDEEPSSAFRRGHRRGGSYETALLGRQQQDSSAARRARAPSSVNEQQHEEGEHSPSHVYNEYSAAYSSIEEHLRPLLPAPDLPESIAIFQETCLLADEYVAVQAELQQLRTEKEKLVATIEEQQKIEELLRKHEEMLREEESLKLQINNRTSE